jgi:N-methylhydantoinase B
MSGTKEDVMTGSDTDVLTDRRLRDLTEDEFRQRYGCDRFTATVLSNRFAFVIDNIKDQLLRTAFSPIVRGSDFAAGLSGPPSMHWPMAAVSQTVPTHVGSIPDAVRITLEEYGLDQLAPGDVITCNDYFRVGTHLNDVVFIRPLFLDGTLIGALALRCHQIDMGGKAPGGFQASKANRYEDGLALPPMKLFSAGEPVKEVVKLFMANTRFGPLLYNDMHTINACLKMGEGLLLESIAKYGPEAYLGAIHYTDDVSAETMASALERLPDGIYEAEELIDTDFLPDSPEYRIKMRINKRGRRAEVDLSGSSRSARSALNSAWPDARTGIVLGLKCLIDRHSRYTSGSLRPIDVVLPPDSFVNPDPPHACQYYFELVISMIMAVFRTLNPALGQEAVAHDAGSPGIGSVSGTTEDGRAEMLHSGSRVLGVTSGGAAPWGGSRYGDGLSSSSTLTWNTRSLGDEAEYTEVGAPLNAVVIGSGLMPDTGGPGEFRGGVARYQDTQWLVPTTQSSTHVRMKRPPSGVYGGGDGGAGASWAWLPEENDIDPDIGLPITLQDPIYAKSVPLIGVLDPATHEVDLDGKYFDSETPLSCGPGTVVRDLRSGAGGWGDPLDRDPELVVRDVRDEYVTIAGARRDYGVIIDGDPIEDPEGLRLDIAATDRERVARRQGMET